MKLTNKTIQYKVKGDDQNGKMVEISDTADVQLPDIEKMTDTVKGAGILGEIDMPTLGQIGSMGCTINFRADNQHCALLARPGFIKLEIIWVNETVDSTLGKTETQQNKAFMTVMNKKFGTGKIEVGASMESSMEFEVLSYRKVVNGIETMLLDKLNFKFVINGVDYMEKVKNALQ